jgi:hypothetical protein
LTAYSFRAFKKKLALVGRVFAQPYYYTISLHVQGDPFKKQPQLLHMKTFPQKNHETNDNLEFLQPYPVVAADALL